MAVAGSMKDQMVDGIPDPALCGEPGKARRTRQPGPGYEPRRLVGYDGPGRNIAGPTRAPFEQMSFSLQPSSPLHIHRFACLRKSNLSAEYCKGFISCGDLLPESSGARVWPTPATGSTDAESPATAILIEKYGSLPHCDDVRRSLDKF